MIKSVTAGMILLCLAAFVLFAVERKVTSLQSELKEINRQLVADQEAIHTLKAEWAYVSRPERIRAIAARYLPLQAVLPQQIRGVESIGLAEHPVAADHSRPSSLMLALSR